MFYGVSYFFVIEYVCCHRRVLLDLDVGLGCGLLCGLSFEDGLVTSLRTSVP